MGKESLKSHVTNKKNSRSGWHGGKNDTISNAERKRLGLPVLPSQDKQGGRKRGTPNLIKNDDGTLTNQYGVTFTPADKKALENEVNKANRKRMKMLEEEGKLPRLVSGKETGQNVSSLQAMGKESDFILARKTKSLQRFKSQKDFERYMHNLKHVNSPEYLTERVEAYKTNHIKALENVFGDDAQDVISKIKMMKPKDYMKMVQSDEDLEINYVYNEQDKQGRLNRIRAGMGLKLKEDYIPET